MVPIIKIHRPSSENVDEFNEFDDLDDVLMHDSGLSGARRLMA